MKSIEDIKDILEKYTRPYRSYSSGEIDALYEVYNTTFNKNESFGGCAACVEEIYEKLYLIYKDKYASSKT